MFFFIDRKLLNLLFFLNRQEILFSLFKKNNCFYIEKIDSSTSKMVLSVVLGCCIELQLKLGRSKV